MTYFQFWVSLRYYTAMILSGLYLCLLWLTFNFEYLWDITQPIGDFTHKNNSCDLLSILSIFEILHSNIYKMITMSKVVTYFQFWVSLRYYTASFGIIMELITLWLTFNFEYLWDITQQLPRVPKRWHRCDLLSILSIFEILHS